MASDEEVLRQLAELSTRVDSLAREVEALRSTPPAPYRQPVQARSKIEPAAGAQRLQTLEGRIGSQFLNRIGIFAVLIAVAWFLKLAFDRDWIGPGVRILVGLAIAVGMIVWSERFRRNGFSAFSYTLKALGAGVAYLALWAASSVYHLVPAAIVFLAMTAVMLTNAWLAWRQNSELLAVYALAGGLATPALLSFGGRHEGILFSYLLMLDAGALLLFALRPWKRLIVCAFAGTVAYSVLWAVRYYDPPAFSATLAFTGIFFAAFAVTPFLFLEKMRPAAPSPRDLLFLVAFPVANGAVVFAALMTLFADPSHHPLRPWIVFALAAVFLLLARLAPSAGVLSHVHLGMAVFFLVVAIPLEFSGCAIALCWLVVALALIALAAARPSAALRLFGAVVLTLAALDVILLEWVAPAQQPLSVLANAHFATYLVAAAVFAGVARLSLGVLQGANRPERVTLRPPSSRSFGSWTYLAAFSTILFSLIVLLAVSLEVHHYWFCGATFFHDFCGASLVGTRRAVYAGFSYSAWYMLYGAALMAVGFWRCSAFLRWQALLLLGFSIAKVFLVDASHLSSGYRVLSFLVLGVLLLAISFAYQKDWLAFRNAVEDAEGSAVKKP